ncbi:unnamed protein product [Mytilus coruscus]|uniref:Uncharacterized protein n=1 Tax=Mytilus coruscus TaxID=42192 RepID=A0A6J8DAF1_MYTCO|nr:unnamed protein product [Mytilus coruscus]
MKLPAEKASFEFLLLSYHARVKWPELTEMNCTLEIISTLAKLVKNCTSLSKTWTTTVSKQTETFFDMLCVNELSISQEIWDNVEKHLPSGNGHVIIRAIKKFRKVSIVGHKIKANEITMLIEDIIENFKTVVNKRKCEGFEEIDVQEYQLYILNYSQFAVDMQSQYNDLAVTLDFKKIKVIFTGTTVQIVEAKVKMFEILGKIKCDLRGEFCDQFIQYLSIQEVDEEFQKGNAIGMYSFSGHEAGVAFDMLLTSIVNEQLYISNSKCVVLDSEQWLNEQKTIRRIHQKALIEIYIVNGLSDRKVSIYSISSRAARNEHWEIKKFLLQYTPLNFPINPTKTLKEDENIKPTESTWKIEKYLQPIVKTWTADRYIKPTAKRWKEGGYIKPIAKTWITQIDQSIYTLVGDITCLGVDVIVNSVNKNLQLKQGLARLMVDKAKGCGGIELLKCNQNSRDLQVIDCTWSVKKLKDYLGNQAKLYVRPIQKDLDMEPVQRSCNSRSEVKCNSCFKTFSVKDIREHTNTCVMSKLNEENPYSDSDELLDPMLNCNDTVKDDSTSILLKDDEINVVAPATNTDATKSFVNQNIDHADDFCTSIPLSVSNMSNSASMVQQEEADTCICSASPENNNAAQIPSQLHLNCKSEQNSDLDHIIANGIDECLRTEMNDPVEILRYFQGLIVTGRKLELQHEDTVQPEPDNHDGSTNFIMVDRSNILQTALEEIGATQETDLRKTLETASDYGDQERFFRLVLNAIYKKYFEKGLRSYMADDYTTVGKIMALSILQNGSLPTFLNEEILNDLFASSDPESICSKNLRIGLDSLGLVRTKKHYTHTKTVIGLLRPVFSEDGTNSRVFENATYAAFMRYLRVVASKYVQIRLNVS